MSILLSLLFVLLLFMGLGEITISQVLPPISDHFVTQGVQDTGALNIINAILFDYRSFDTIGEATVIFATAAGFKLLFASKRAPAFQTGLSPIVKTGISIFSPVIFIFGAFVVVAGHLAPGGAFQGGVVLASMMILLAVVYGLRFQVRKTIIKPRIATVAESVSALFFVLIGLEGLVAGQYFLVNSPIFPLGEPGQLASAGSIPLLNIASGIKVAAGFYLIFNFMAGGE